MNKRGNRLYMLNRGSNRGPAALGRHFIFKYKRFLYTKQGVAGTGGSAANALSWHQTCRTTKSSSRLNILSGNLSSRTSCFVRTLPAFENLRIDGRRPAVPVGVRIYAIGDIHGRLDLLNPLLLNIAADIDRYLPTRSVCVFLGDYVDRGPWSRETIDTLIKFSELRESLFLKGNHEAMAINGLTDPSLFDQWLRVGGVETLTSYGVPAAVLAAGRPIVELQSAFHRLIPQNHFRFFRDLTSSFVCGDFFFAHAGVKPKIDLSRQKEADLLWIREEFLSSNEDFGKIIVHGHTPTNEIEIRRNRINIDTGAFSTGRLTCLAIGRGPLCVIESSLGAR
jgi:serine/threonine protein phosphatase 1